MNAITERKGTEVATPQKNFFEEYADAYSTRNIVGQLLKFSKGDWLLGEGNDQLDVGTELACNMPELMFGWICWNDNKPVSHVMGRIADGYRPPKRAELGDLDEATWEVDEVTHQPRDPWQLSNYLIMKPPGAVDDDSLMTFAASSKGGRDAIIDLSRTYGRAMRQRAGQLPIVKLGVDSYQHKNKAYGRIKIPLLTVIGWAPANEFEAALGMHAANEAARKEDQEEDIPF